MDALALLLADSRFPSGGYAHSLGLEQAVVDGLTDVPAFVRARQRLVAAADARVAVAARRVAAGDEPSAAATDDVAAGDHDRRAATADDPAAATRASRALVALDDEWSARCPSAILRDAARRLGSGLLRSAMTVWDDPRLRAYREASTATPRPVALGVVGAVAGIDDEAVALLSLYDDAATVTSAALKLLPLDPAVTARWLAELAPALEHAAREAAADRRPVAEQPAPAAVALEVAASVHQARRERLFAS
jgi:urease accessory protein